MTQGWGGRAAVRLPQRWLACTSHTPACSGCPVCTHRCEKQSSLRPSAALAAFSNAINLFLLLAALNRITGFKRKPCLVFVLFPVSNMPCSAVSALGERTLCYLMVFHCSFCFRAKHCKMPRAIYYEKYGDHKLFSL